MGTNIYKYIKCVYNVCVYIYIHIYKYKHTTNPAVVYIICRPTFM